MKISKAIFAADDSYFMEFWPIQAKICKEVLGIEPVLFYICDDDSDFYSDGHGLVRKIKKVDDINTGLLACISRMYGTKFFPNEVCITCDMDMLMISKEYFIKQVEKYDEDSLVIYSSDAYDLKRPEATELFANIPFPFTQEMYNYPYNAAKGSTFNKMLDTDCSFETFVRRHATYKDGYHYMWMIDEFYFADCVNHKDHGVEVHKLKRGYNSPWIANNRIERHNFPVRLEIPEEAAMQEKTGWVYDKEALIRGEYYDANCCRPYSKYKEAIDELVELILRSSANKKRDLIIISAYCDNPIKEDQLRNLVGSLSKEKSAFDIMVVSHTPIPIDIARNCDYAIFDKKNERLEDEEAIGCSWFAFECGSRIHSIYMHSGKPGSHHISIWRMMAIGNIMAGNLGYNKVHHIEYDTRLESLNEIHANSLILDEFDVVMYKFPSDITFHGCYMAYRLDKVTKRLQECNEEYFLEYSKKGNPKNPENLLERMLRIGETAVYEKVATDLAQNGMHTNLSMQACATIDNGLTWCIPFYNTEDNSLCFFIWNEFDSTVNAEIIYNDTLIKKSVDPKTWVFFPLDENYENAKKLTSIVNGKLHQTYNFDDIRWIFKLSSYYKQNV